MKQVMRYIISAGFPEDAGWETETSHLDTEIPGGFARYFGCGCCSSHARISQVRCWRAPRFIVPGTLVCPHSGACFSLLLRRAGRSTRIAGRIAHKELLAISERYHTAVSAVRLVLRLESFDKNLGSSG